MHLEMWAMMAGLPPVEKMIEDGWSKSAIIRRLVIAYEKEKAERTFHRREAKRLDAARRK